MDPTVIDVIINKGDDFLLKIEEEKIPETGMLIDRKLYCKFEDKVKEDPNVKDMMDNLDIERLEWYLQNEVFDKPNEYFNISKLEQSLGIDRRITIKEVAMNILGLLKGYKTKKEKLADEFNNFKLLNKNELETYSVEQLNDIQVIFEAYIEDEFIRESVFKKQYSNLMNSAIKDSLRRSAMVKIKNKPLLEYIKDYVAENDINCENYKRR